MLDQPLPSSCNGYEKGTGDCAKRPTGSTATRHPATVMSCSANTSSGRVTWRHRRNVGANSLASLHLYSTVTDAVKPHEFSEECTGPAERIAELFVDPRISENGETTLSDRPGLGAEFDEMVPEKAIAEYRW